MTEKGVGQLNSRMDQFEKVLKNHPPPPQAIIRKSSRPVLLSKEQPLDFASPLGGGDESLPFGNDNGVGNAALLPDESTTNSFKSSRINTKTVDIKQLKLAKKLKMQSDLDAGVAVNDIEIIAKDRPPPKLQRLGSVCTSHKSFLDKDSLDKGLIKSSELLEDARIGLRDISSSHTAVSAYDLMSDDSRNISQNNMKTSTEIESKDKTITPPRQTNSTLFNQRASTPTFLNSISHFSNINWSKVNAFIQEKDLISAYENVLNYGSLEDLGVLLGLTGAKLKVCRYGYLSITNYLKQIIKFNSRVYQYHCDPRYLKILH